MNVMDLSQLDAAPWGKALLQDISLTLPAGSILGIIGPNGAGKSSLLQVLSGLASPSRGRIDLLGQPMAQWPSLERARCLAMLPQHSTLSFPFSVEEVILLGRTPHATGLAADLDILEQAMEVTDTARLRQRLYTRLSGGEQQRVQLARVFAQIWPTEAAGGRLLLLDEPTAALDLHHQYQMIDILRRLAQDGCAIALVMHDLNLLAGLADQFLVLSAGRTVAQGNAAEVLRESMFKQVFQVDVSIGAHPRSGKPLVIPL